jgi:hypothetical protein
MVLVEEAVNQRVATGGTTLQVLLLLPAPAALLAVSGRNCIHATRATRRAGLLLPGLPWAACALKC